MDDNANVVMVMAKSHFRDRVLSPLVLLHHKIENNAASIGRMKGGLLHHDVDRDGKEAKIYTWMNRVP